VGTNFLMAHKFESSFLMAHGYRLLFFFFLFFKRIWLLFYADHQRPEPPKNAGPQRKGPFGGNASAEESKGDANEESRLLSVLHTKQP
jgi:hypothetical protein